MNKLCSRFEIPDSLISDRDPQAPSSFLKDIYARLGIAQNLSTAFHPWSDGQTERMNRTVLEEVLCVVLEERGN